MNRREFLTRTTAALGALGLPLGSVAGAGTTAKAAAVTARNPQMMYGWACVYAQMNEGVTPAKLAEAFRMSPSDARIVFDRMLERGVLLPPGLDGTAKASRPWRPWEDRARNRIRAAFARVMDHVVKDDSYGWRGA